MSGPARSVLPMRDPGEQVLQGGDGSSLWMAPQPGPSRRTPGPRPVGGGTYKYEPPRGAVFVINQTFMLSVLVVAQGRPFLSRMLPPPRLPKYPQGVPKTRPLQACVPSVGLRGCASPYSRSSEHAAKVLGKVLLTPSLNAISFLSGQACAGQGSKGGAVCLCPCVKESPHEHTRRRREGHLVHLLVSVCPAMTSTASGTDQ